MDIKEILGIFEKYGYGGGFLSITLMLGWYILKSEWFNNFFEKLSDKIFKNKEKTNNIIESDILNHDIFNYIDFWMYSKVPTIVFSTEYRTVVFRKYLIIFLKKYKENLKLFINDKSFEEMNNSELWASVLKLINDIIYDYEKEMRLNGIPDLVIEKMKIKNNDSISLTIDLIEGICNSQFYNSDKNLLKIYSILNILLSILENGISNSDRICDTINGQLKGLKFDGKVEP